MTDHKNGPHLYGTADPDNPEPVAEGGLRGERSAGQEPDAGVSTREREFEGRKVTIEETSGTAAAEEDGKTGQQEETKGDR